MKRNDVCCSRLRACTRTTVDEMIDRFAEEEELKHPRCAQRSTLIVRPRCYCCHHFRAHWLVSARIVELKIVVFHQKRAAHVPVGYNKPRVWQGGFRMAKVY